MKFLGDCLYGLALGMGGHIGWAVIGAILAALSQHVGN